jgi:hypothetical protein
MCIDELKEAKRFDIGMRDYNSASWCTYPLTPVEKREKSGCCSARTRTRTRARSLTVGRAGGDVDMRHAM